MPEELDKIPVRWWNNGLGAFYPQVYFLYEDKIKELYDVIGNLKEVIPTDEWDEFVEEAPEWK